MKYGIFVLVSFALNAFGGDYTLPTRGVYKCQDWSYRNCLLVVRTTPDSKYVSITFYQDPNHDGFSCNPAMPSVSFACGESAGNENDIAPKGQRHCVGSARYIARGDYKTELFDLEPFSFQYDMAAGRCIYFDSFKE